MEEQSLLLRRLWTETAITHACQDEPVTAAGLAPAPQQRLAPIWFGAETPAAVRRAG